jgi:predicted TIM-barrel fold metal-dependent hydrolase
MTPQDTGPALLWANSGDSHVVEPPDLWTKSMPARLAERMPRSEEVDERTEIIHVDGYSFTWNKGVNPQLSEEDLVNAGLVARGREPGIRALDMFFADSTRDLALRHEDLDHEGIWGEIVYPSIGLWNGLIRDPELYREGVRALNDWLADAFLRVTSRSVPAAEISVLSVDDAVAETIRVAELGFKAITVPTSLEESMAWNDRRWELLWSTVEETGMVLASHIGSDVRRSDGPGVRPFHGDGAAVLNYVETSYGGQRLATMLVASGVLDRHPKLRLLISEGGASWVPFVADRMTECYRQHGVWVRPKLSRPPKQIMFEQVYASFQHDQTAVTAHTAMGYENVMWGSDYPHMEGTFGHTQETLHELFDGVEERARDRIMRGAFLELFPHVGEPPGMSSGTSGSAEALR